MEEKLRNRINSSIKKEIDKKNIWDCNGYKEYNHASQKDWNQTIITLINKLYESGDKYDCIICSPEVNAILSELLFFQPVESFHVKEFYRSGVINYRYNVYVDCYIPVSSLLLVNQEKFFNSDSDIDSDIIYVENITK